MHDDSIRKNVTWQIYKGPHMSAYVLLNLLNELGK